jgi:hypothetical protein
MQTSESWQLFMADSGIGATSNGGISKEQYRIYRYMGVNVRPRAALIESRPTNLSFSLLQRALGARATSLR